MKDTGNKGKGSTTAMKSDKAYILYAEGVEEVEGVATVDALRRGGMQTKIISTCGKLTLKGATGQTLGADLLLEGADLSDAEWLIIPGGVPGADNLHSNPLVQNALLEHYARGGRIAAICAGPAFVLAPMGLLHGRKATCYPEINDKLAEGGAIYVREPVVTDGPFLTSEGPGTALQFACAILRETFGDAVADRILKEMVVVGASI